MLLDAAPDAPERLDFGWRPELVEPSRRRVGAGFWVAAGLCTLLLSWLLLSMTSFVAALFQQSLVLGALAAVAVAAGVSMIGFALALEVRAYLSLGTVERLRQTLAAGETTVAVAREQGGAWLDQVAAGVPDAAAARRMLQDAVTIVEVRSILHSKIAEPLRETATTVGRRAAVEGATLVAICPHPAWDGVIAGGRGLLVIRQIAALYGLRPGLAVTLALVRRVAWTAAGTTGVSLVSQALADHALTTVPVLKHLAGALPGTGAVAVRLYRLAGLTAEACSPVS